MLRFILEMAKTPKQEYEGTSKTELVARIKKKVKSYRHYHEVCTKLAKISGS